MSEQTLFDRLGGKPAIEAAVDIFYNKIVADTDLFHIFKEVDMKRLRSHQKMFMAFAFGGVAAYTGRNLRETHKDVVEKHGLTDHHFDRISRHLTTTLNDLKVAPDLIEEVLQIVGTTRNDVLNR